MRSHVALQQNIVESLDVVARNQALQQAQQAKQRDPSAAALLTAYAQASSPEKQQENVNSVQFNPMKLLARMARFYNWTPKYMLKEMDYVQFFGFVREANAIIAEENNTQPSNNQVVTDPLVAQLMVKKQFGELRKYQGDVVRID